MLTVEDKNENVDEELLFNEWKNELERCNRKDDENSLQKDTFKYFLGPQLSSACAIVGGVVAQEAIKALSGIEEPLQNFFVYSALNTAGVVCRLPPLL
ncbi:hypothetical protein AB6A40_004633 [Gnathostoma spinigerum]|uniref:Uncharacterized protein n=1 Tax=Gnathostoma spinigerum TaxID=75299 RepID=A0ABD6ED22_9BILA